MKKIIYVTLSSFTMMCIPVMAFAQIATTASLGPLGRLLENILSVINSILIPFIIGIGFLFFVWGMFLYFIKGGADDEEKKKGKSLMIWAIVGFVLIIIFWGVINLLAASTGLDRRTIENLPVVPGGR